MPRHNIFHNLHNITCGQHIIHSRVLGTVLDYQIGQVLGLGLVLASLVLGLGFGLAGQVLVNITDNTAYNTCECSGRFFAPPGI